MDAENSGINATVKRLFTKSNMDDLPAMSTSVQELIAVTNDPQATAEDVTEAILKDFSLTSKILQVANSAYYNRGVPITTITRAVTGIGFNTVRELALTIALFEDFVKRSHEKDNLSKLLAQSFLSAMLLKVITEKKKFRLHSEDAFICALLYNLGRIVVVVYLPDRYEYILEIMRQGKSEKIAAKTALEELTFHDIGREMARHWQFSDIIIDSMTDSPIYPKGPHETEFFMQNLVMFCNKLITIICYEKKIGRLLDDFGRLFQLDKKEALDLTNKCVDISTDISDVVTYGLKKLQINKKIQHAGKPSSSSPHY